VSVQSNFEWLVGSLLRDDRVPLLQQRAYLLATARHETGGTFNPGQYERYNGDPQEYFKRYDGRLGNVEPGDGYRYRGAGFVQLTGRSNFKHMGDRLSIPLEEEPWLAVKEQHSYDILVVGMTFGLFTGIPLSKYVYEGEANYFSARRVVNGLDRAGIVAGYARQYEGVLKAIRA
jgi:putative chitinase